MKKRYTKIPIEIKGVDPATATLEAVFSTDDVDRHGDIVEQNFDLKAFKKNPVLLNSHDYSDAAQVIGKVEKLSTKTGRLEGKVKFAVMENPKAKVIYDLYAGGFLSAFSIGFIPLDFDDKGKIVKSELLEISAVSVPANAMATAKSKGINVDLLDEEEIEEKSSTCEKCDCEHCTKQREDEEVDEKSVDDAEDPNEQVEEVEEEAEVEDEEIEDEPEEDDDTEDEEKSFEKVVKTKKQKQIEALRKIRQRAEAKKRKRQELLKESLAVIQQLSAEVDCKKAKRQQMVNRAVRQLLKVKHE